MRHTVLSIPALILGVSGCVFAQGAPPPTKVGIIQIQKAIASTKDGQKAAAELNTKFAPTRARLEKKQTEIEGDRARLNSGSNAMAADQKEKLMRDIDQKTKALNRDAEDAQAEVDQETGKIMQQLGDRILAVIKKYSIEHGYALILDVSSQQTPVVHAADQIDITEDIIKLYDQNAPAPTTSSAPPAAAPRPAAAAPSPAKKAPAPKQP